MKFLTESVSLITENFFLEFLITAKVNDVTTHDEVRGLEICNYTFSFTGNQTSSSNTSSIDSGGTFPQFSGNAAGEISSQVRVVHVQVPADGSGPQASGNTAAEVNSPNQCKSCFLISPRHTNYLLIGLY